MAIDTLCEAVLPGGLQVTDTFAPDAAGRMVRSPLSAQSKMPIVGASGKLFGRGGGLKHKGVRLGGSNGPRVDGVQKYYSYVFRLGVRGGHNHPITMYSNRPWLRG